MAHVLPLWFAFNWLVYTREVIQAGLSICVPQICHCYLLLLVVTFVLSVY
mgnify:CR=1 FL=1